jgi:cellulose synthase/poly-beta-1,6-N-acetylglucosamine synthase-like glycosyltransferase
MNILIYNPRVSIIIPCKDIGAQTSECIDTCKQLDYDNFEIIVLPDDHSKGAGDIKIIATGSVSPGRKRNIGAKNSTGDFLAFIDSDAYPRRDWLKNAVRYFSDPEIAGVGGPGVTPEEDHILQKAGGYILSSFMVGGLANRYGSAKSRESDDIHSCNFIARRTILDEIGGWNEKYWPGEDTLICLGIDKLNKKMIEASDVVVYHHRRPLFSRHLLQVSRFGQHRGFFAKRFPENSLRLNYFIPSLFVLFLAAGIVVPFMHMSIQVFYIFLFSIYLLAGIAVSLDAAAAGKDIRYLPLVFAGIIVTHIVYGVHFISGVAARELER